MAKRKHRTNIELLPDEDPDLRSEIVRTIGEEWLSAKNPLLGGATPDKLIGTRNEYKVRNILRSIIVAALS